VGQRLRHSKEQATVVCTEIKYSDFRSVSHQTILSVPTASDEQIYQTSVALFDELWDLSPIRLLGIRTSKLVSAGEPVQLTLFDTPQQTISPKREKLDAALDSIRSKYGHDAIMRGSLLSYPNNKTSKE
jgi:DNA polymerase-4